MARLDAYATAAQYRDQTGKVSTSDDDLILELLTTVSRVIERRVRVVPGAFNSYTGTVTLNGSGTPRLYLRDAYGQLNFLQSIDSNSLKIDSDQDGVYDDYLWDLNDGWIHGTNPNASDGSEPYTALEIWPTAIAPLANFPSYRGCVQITGTWGWSAVPGGIKERVIEITRELAEIQVAGPTLTIADVDSNIQMNPSTRSLMSMIEREYNYYVPGHRAV